MRANGNPRAVLFAVAFLASLGTVLAPCPAYGQACGDEIRTDTVLTADLGPCPGDGLIVVGSVTLDLGGFTIRGSGGGIGVDFRIGGTVTIQGPGTITNFGTGIRIIGSNAPTGSTVQGTTLTENITGIGVNRSLRPRIINNMIDAGARGVTGIFLSEVSGTKIKGNVIAGHSGTGIDVLSQAQSVIVLNSVSRNGTGLTYREGIDPNSITIRDNQFFDNTQDGVSILPGRPVNLTLDFNTITGNGGNGVSVSGRVFGANLIGDNVVDNNGGQGIALANIFVVPLVPPGSLQIIDNEVLGNAAVDLFWDGSGGNICWKFNIFGTSDPATLPACP